MLSFVLQNWVPSLSTISNGLKTIGSWIYGMFEFVFSIPKYTLDTLNEISQKAADISAANERQTEMNFKKTGSNRNKLSQQMRKVSAKLGVEYRSLWSEAGLADSSDCPTNILELFAACLDSIDKFHQVLTHPKVVQTVKNYCSQEAQKSEL